MAPSSFQVRNTEYSEEEQVAAQKEKTYEELRQEIIEKVGLCHPVSYDNLDLCAMAKGNRLTQLSIAMLNIICEFFDIPQKISTTKERKSTSKPLISLFLHVTVINRLVISSNNFKMQPLKIVGE